MTLPTKLSLTMLDIKIAEEYTNTVSLYRSAAMFIIAEEYTNAISLYRSAAMFINALHHSITSRKTFESFAWTNYCHHVKKSKRGKTVIGLTRQGEELWRITYKGNRKYTVR